MAEHAGKKAGGVHAALERALGAAGLASAETLARWRMRYAHWLSGEHALVGGARPADTDALGAVLDVARAHGCTVWCFADASGFGALAAPPTRAVIGIDLSAMNRILELDTLSGYALIEPGVTYGQLHAALAGREPRFWCDTDADPARSVAAGMLGRGIGYTAYGDRTLMQCGMELMLADGGLVRTGMGALPRGNMWQLFKYGYGPYMDGSFQQSELGIVTKLGTWIMPAPQAYKPFAVRLADDAALHAALEAVRPLKVTPVIPSTVAIARPAWDRALLAGAERPGGAPPGDGQGWRLYAALSGTTADVEAVWPFVSATLGALPGATLLADLDRSPEPLHGARAALMGPGGGAGIPPAAGSVVELAAVAPIDGDAALAMAAIAEPMLRDHGFPPLCELRVSWRTMVMHLALPFHDPGTLERARGCALAVNEAWCSAGWGVVSASTEVLHAARRRYRGGLEVVGARLKAGLDPDGLLAG